MIHRHKLYISSTVAALFVNYLPTAGPRILDQAFAEAKATNKPVVAIAVPAEAFQKINLGYLLTTLIDGEPAGRGERGSYFYYLDAHELFSDAVFVCLDEKQWANIKNTVPGENYILLNEARERVAGFSFAPAALRLSIDRDAANLSKMLRDLLHGEKGDRLAQRKDEAKKRLIPEAVAAFERFFNHPETLHFIANDETIEASAARKLKLNRNRTPSLPAEIPGTNGKLPRPSAELLHYVDFTITPADERMLLDHLQTALPWLIWERRRIENDITNNKTNAARNARLRALIETAFESSDRYRNEPLLPFGLAVAPPGKDRPPIDTCPPCGMGAVAVRDRQFLDFVTK